MQIILLTLILALSLAATADAGVHQADASPKTVDQARLEETEELSESLANDMLDLSVAVRDGDGAQIATFLAPKIVARRFPTNPAPHQPLVKWVEKHAWTAGTSAAAEDSLTRKQFLADLQRFAAHFSEIEDARFKVKAATYDDTARAVMGAKIPTAKVGATGTARIAFYLIGRNVDGQREWARGTADVRVRYAASRRWQFEKFDLVSLESMVATRDLFSEVAVPAGVDRKQPAYGDPGNQGFVWEGAAAADFNNDTWLDLFVAGKDHSRLYLNNGKGGFAEVSAHAGLTMLDSGVAPLALDFDNDGDQDVFLSAVGAQVMLENRMVPEGKLAFRDVSGKMGVGVQAIGFSATAADINADGVPDMYVAAYNHYGKVVPNSWFRATNGTANLLFVSQPNGTYKEEAAKWGVDDRRWSYAAAFHDVNGDGKLDLYVANDFGENALFIREGDRFVDRAGEFGVMDPGNGMGVSWGDYNNDGRVDLHVTNMSSTAGNRILSRLFPQHSAKDNVLKKLAAGNNLYECGPDGKFRDVTAEVGGFGGGWAWGGGFLDFDNDGWEDFYAPNGFISGKSMKDT